MCRPVERVSFCADAIVVPLSFCTYVCTILYSMNKDVFLVCCTYDNIVAVPTAERFIMDHDSRVQIGVVYQRHDLGQG